MRIRVSQPALVPDLVEFLGRALCRTESVHGSVLEVALPSVSDRACAKRDLDLPGGMVRAPSARRGDDSRRLIVLRSG